MKITQIYKSLGDNRSEHQYTASAIDGFVDVYLAVNSLNYPSLIVKTKRTFGLPMLKAAKVTFKPSQDLNITMAGQSTIEGTYHILECESTSRIDVENFLTLIEAFLSASKSPNIKGEEIVAFFRSMTRLFALKPATDLELRRQGLWGELFMMENIQGFGFWAPFWHGAVTGLFDFSSGGKHVEVKSTLGQQRIHHFSHRQIWAPQGEEIMIASLMLSEDGTGLSLRELINRCRSAFRGLPDYLKLEFAVRYAGMEDEFTIGPQYNAEDAKRNLAIYRAVDAPHFQMPEPSGVSETSYKVDLTTATPIANEELNLWLDTFL